MAKSKKNVFANPFSRHFGFTVFVFLLLFSLLAGIGYLIHLYFFYQDHFLPGANLAVSTHPNFATYFNAPPPTPLSLANLAPSQAETLATSHFVISPDLQISIQADSHHLLSSSSAQLGLVYDFPATFAQILATQRSLSPLTLLHRVFSPAATSFSPIVTYSESALNHFLAILAQQVRQVGYPGFLTLDDSTSNPQIHLDHGKNDITLNYVETKKSLLSSLQLGLPTVPPYLDTKPLALTPAQATALQATASALLAKALTLTTDQLDHYQLKLNPQDFLPLLGPESATKSAALAGIITQIETDVTRPAQQPQLIVDSTATKVEKFVPPLDGLSLQTNLFTSKLTTSLPALAATPDASLTLSLPLVVTPPTHSLAATNSLGINEQIGFGESLYAHSIAGRIHNVALTASRINNTLVAPGAEFSFNQTLGPVSGETGFQPGYVIQGGRSVLSDGGGVCQVSTTLFRALLDAGLQITRRLPHSYRVSYYELNNDPGFDATVYSGNVDLRFINDTGHHLLITSETDSDHLYMNVKIYGTSDGRYSQITNYRKFNALAAPPPEYIPDPTLAPGQTQQIDWAVGGLQTTFTHTIYNADGSLRSQKDYPSTYRAWSAKFLVGP